MDPQTESTIRDWAMDGVRHRLGDDYVEDNAKFLAAQWEWVKQLGMIDVEADLRSATRDN